MNNKIIVTNINKIGDPVILLEDNVYYMYTTCCGGRPFHVYTSLDCKTFTDMGECLHIEDTFADRDIWAPEVIKYQGKFYMFYSGRSDSDGLMHVQIAVSNSPLGPFKDIAAEPIIKIEGKSTIDAHCYIEDDEKYLFFSMDCSTNIINGIHTSQIYAVKLASDANMSNAWKQTGWALAAKAAKGAGKNNEAESCYRNALSCDAKTRDYIECCYLLGELLMQRKNFVEAEERFAEAARLSVDMPEFNELRIYSYIGHGHSAIAQGKRNEGIRLLIAASLLFSHDTLLPPVMEEVISLLKEEGRNDEAKSVREDLIRMYPNSEEAKRCAAEAN
jgi:tetratricopeptide (TPR) repeat protein